MALMAALALQRTNLRIPQRPARLKPHWKKLLLLPMQNLSV
jgi:hypothetical protein